MTKFCNLYSGSSGNCLFISSNKTRILIDTGLSGIAIERALHQIDESPEDIDAILISHDHSDHISGAGVLSRRYGLPVYANKGTWDAMQSSLGKIKKENIRLFKAGEGFEIGCFGIESFRIPHDAKEPVAFCFYYDQKKFTTATDIGHMTKELSKKFEDSDLLLLESNHDINMLNAGPYPYFLKRRILGENGHLSNEAAASVICDLAKKGMRKFIIGHLSKENNYPALAYETTKAALSQEGLTVGKDVLLEVALRDKVGSICRI